MYTVFFSKQANKDKKLLKQAGLEDRAKQLLNIIKDNPFQNSPPYEKLIGDIKGLYSRRINITHRIVYKVNNQQIIILRMWTHYGD